MGKQVGWTESARNELRGLPQPIALRMLQALGRYALTGTGDIKHLKETHPPELRLRVGDYRIRFQDLGSSIIVLAVKHRREAYR